MKSKSKSCFSESFSRLVAGGNHDNGWRVVSSWSGLVWWGVRCYWLMTRVRTRYVCVALLLQFDHFAHGIFRLSVHILHRVWRHKMMRKLGWQRFQLWFYTVVELLFVPISHHYWRVESTLSAPPSVLFELKVLIRVRPTLSITSSFYIRSKSWLEAVFVHWVGSKWNIYKSWNWLKWVWIVFIVEFFWKTFIRLK